MFSSSTVFKYCRCSRDVCKSVKLCTSSTSTSLITHMLYDLLAELFRRDLVHHCDDQRQHKRLDFVRVFRSNALQNVCDSIFAHLNQNRASLADAQVVQEDEAHSLKKQARWQQKGSEVFQHVVDERDADFVVEVEITASSLGGDVDVGALF